MSSTSASSSSAGSTSGAAGGGDAAGPEEEGGCGCHLVGHTSALHPPWLLVLGLAGAGWAVRRRRPPGQSNARRLSGGSNRRPHP
jgi:hypothetical protein